MARVLVTGGAGYIGSHVLRAIAEQAHDAVVLDNLQNGHRASVEGFDLREVDLRDGPGVRACLEDVRPDAVIHLAALASVPESVRDPRPYFGTNIIGGLNLLEAMAESGTRLMVFSSSAAVYGQPKQSPIPEEALKCPTNPYGVTKLQYEEVLRWYDQAYGLRSVSLRYFCAAGAAADGTIGEAHRPERHLIPNVLMVPLGRGTHVSVFGSDYPTPDGTCIRDFVHVSDLATAHVRALDGLLSGGATSAYNCGTGRGWSVRQVIEVAGRVCGQEIPMRLEPRRPGDPSELVADVGALRRDLGFVCRFTALEEIIGSAWRWHSAHPETLSDA